LWQSNGSSPTSSKEALGDGGFVDGVEVLTKVCSKSRGQIYASTFASLTKAKACETRQIHEVRLGFRRGSLPLLLQCRPKA